MAPLMSTFDIKMIVYKLKCRVYFTFISNNLLIKRLLKKFVYSSRESTIKVIARSTDLEAIRLSKPTALRVCICRSLARRPHFISILMPRFASLLCHRISLEWVWGGTA